ncbi:hypothetical protein F11_17000 [Rhodospirillum rubrum F11]|nr:hypothetical protein [Rhodospirillum rubrum]AEO49860.1 hypothetical protein F11_17000 [Rhodospirillum rubrum F11]
MVAASLAACNSATNALFPSLGGSSSSSDGGLFNSGNGDGPPQLGSTYFEPDGVSPGQPTGTFVGQKVQAFRSELTALQETIRSQNAQLQALRNKTIQDSNAYHENVGSMRARLQVGTTPGNPILMNRWETAQGQLNTINQDVVLMDQLAQMISVNQSTTAYLLDSERAAYSVPGAVDEDHRQLRILEDETQQTVVLVDRLLNELASDIRRQTAYVANEKGNLGSLAGAVKNGQLFGTTGPDGYSAPGSYGAGAGGGMSYAPMTSTGTAMATRSAGLPSGAPLVVIRFDSPNVAYEGPLSNAVQAALARKPDASFDVVAVSGGSASGAARGAERVVRSLTQMGVPSNRVNLSAASSAGSDEVRVYVR